MHAVVARISAIIALIELLVSCTLIALIPLKSRLLL
jgi:hypothetical protein